MKNSIYDFATCYWFCSDGSHYDSVWENIAVWQVSCVFCRDSFLVFIHITHIQLHGYVMYWYGVHWTLCGRFDFIVLSSKQLKKLRLYCSNAPRLDMSVKQISRPSNLHTTYLSPYSRRWYAQTKFQNFISLFYYNTSKQASGSQGRGEGSWTWSWTLVLSLTALSRFFRGVLVIIGLFRMLGTPRKGTLQVI